MKPEKLWGWQWRAHEGMVSAFQGGGCRGPEEYLEVTEGLLDLPHQVASAQMWIYHLNLKKNAA